MAAVPRRLLCLLIGFSVLGLPYILVFLKLCAWLKTELNLSDAVERDELPLQPAKNIKDQLREATSRQERLKIFRKWNLQTVQTKNKTLSAFYASIPKGDLEAVQRVANQRRKKTAETVTNTTRQETLKSLPPDHLSLIKLRKQGIEVPPNEWEEIPKWADITDSFGEEPVILGMETCQAFRQSVPEARKRVVAPAGNFNTGTNLFSVFFGNNCQGLAEKPLSQVPWGKHNMANARMDNYRINRTRYQPYPSETVLPVVLVRHPVSWMFSTCLHSYAAHWNHTKKNCPHLVQDINADNYDKYDPRALHSVHVAYGYHTRTDRKFYRHASLVHFWKDWIESYAADNLPFSRLIVRLEDIVYHPDKVLKKLCDCAGGKQRPSGKVLIPEESVKVKRDRMRNKTGLAGSLVRGNASDTAGLLKAWKNHASIPTLWERMSSTDRKVVMQVLKDDAGILKLLGYKMEGK